MANEIVNCPWVEIHGFNGWKEYRDFEIWMNTQLDLNEAYEIPVANSYNEVCAFKENWYVHKSSGVIWRRVSPDPPFEGLFEKVNTK